MFTKLNEICPDLPFDDEKKPASEFIMIKDTLFTNGNFIISNILNSYLRKNDPIILIAAHQSYAHYLNVSKRMGLSLEPFLSKRTLQYIDLFSQSSSWIPQDLPFTETTSNFWQECPK